MNRRTSHSLLANRRFWTPSCPLGKKPSGTTVRNPTSCTCSGPCCSLLGVGKILAEQSLRQCGLSLAPMPRVKEVVGTWWGTNLTSVIYHRSRRVVKRDSSSVPGLVVPDIATTRYDSLMTCGQRQSCSVGQHQKG